MIQGEDFQAMLDENAFTQMAQLLDAPPLTWLNDPKACDLTLLSDIMNYLAQHRPEANYFTRFWGDDSVRAVLSDQYRPFDHDVLLPMVIDAFEEMGSPKHKVMRSCIDHHMRGYVLFPEMVLENDPRGGNIHPAMYLTNEETGRGGLRVLPAVFTGYCSNGSIFGLSQTGKEQLIRHRWYDLDILKEKVALMIGDAMNAADAVIQAYVKSYTIKIAKKELPNIIARWSATTAYRMSQEEATAWENNTVQEAAIRSSDITWGDLINGLTVMSHSTESTLKQQKIEGMSGDILANLFNLQLESVPVMDRNGYSQLGF
jgi:hypothetical protein